MIKMIKVLSVLILVFSSISCATAQSPLDLLSQINDSIVQLELHREHLSTRYNEASYDVISHNLKQYGLPSDTYLEHKAYIFEYSEEHEQAKWVAHMITPDITGPGFGRTNDFRVDPLVSTGTTDSTDYFLYEANKPKKRRYTGYGYDRGHLAPSADFRWSKEIVSESYFYSNMSPQVEDFNRLIWADLEGLLRKYVVDNQVSLAVITAPILSDDLPKIKQSPNGVSIPRQFIKVAYDATNQRTVAFLMSNKALPNPPSYYALSVDELEKITGYNYFPNIADSIESSFDKDVWFKNSLNGDATPINQSKLARKYFNTTTGIKQAKSNKVINVCGTVVGTRYSKKGHAWLNLDKKFPNQIFSIMIRKEELVNYPFDPVTEYAYQKLCFEGKVEKWGDMIVMQVKKEELINKLSEK